MTPAFLFLAACGLALGLAFTLLAVADPRQAVDPRRERRPCRTVPLAPCVAAAPWACWERLACWASRRSRRPQSTDWPSKAVRVVAPSTAGITNGKYRRVVKRRCRTGSASASMYGKPGAGGGLGGDRGAFAGRRLHAAVLHRQPDRHQPVRVCQRATTTRPRFVRSLSSHGHRSRSSPGRACGPFDAGA